MQTMVIQKYTRKKKCRQYILLVKKFLIECWERNKNILDKKFQDSKNFLNNDVEFRPENLKNTKKVKSAPWFIFYNQHYVKEAEYGLLHNLAIKKIAYIDHFLIVSTSISYTTTVVLYNSLP